jgi:hypothetical protein
VLALAGLIGWFGWDRSGDGPVGAPDSQGASDPTGDLRVHDIAAPTAEQEEGATLALAESGEGMLDYLQTTPAANRNRILWQVVSGEGFECSAVRTASLVGTSGSIWRAQCGDALVYWIEIDEFSRFSVMPIPYGDGVGPMPPVRLVEPEGTQTR